MTLEELLEAMRALIAAADESGEPLSEEDLERYADMERQVAAINQTAEARSRQQAYDTPVTTRPRTATIGEAEEMRAFNHYIRTGQVEYRALTVGTDASGGFVVPDLFRNEIDRKLKEYGGVREVAQVISTESGQNLEWPTFDGTAQLGEIVAENVQVTELDPAFGIASLDSYLYSTKLVRVPFQLLQDSAIDMGSFLADALAERIARITNQHFTTGTGTGQPDGVATSPTTGVTAASATSIAPGELLSLVHSVDPAYRANARFMMSDAVLAGIRGFRVDQGGGAGTGQFLWEPDFQTGTPGTILGYPITINQDMDQALAVNDVAVLFGDFKRYYVIRDVKSFELLTLKERYADFHQVGYLGFSRTDGTKANTAAVKALVMAAA